MMKQNQQRALHRQSGFSLIEILVGLAIGLLATLVIMQVFSVFEGQKRTTTGSADAQSNGSIALFTIENEMKMAGYGLVPADSSPLECTSLFYGATGITDISPVTITDGGNAAGASDSITIRYATSSGGGIYSPIKGTGIPGANDVSLENSLGCQVGDAALIINGTTCNFTSVTAMSTPTSGVYPTVTLNDPTGANAPNTSLSCLGAWHTTLFQVNPSYNPTSVASAAKAYLQRTDSLYPVPASGNLPAAPAVADIVNIQAQYGISATANSNLVNQWVDATGSWAAPTVADRNRIKAVRIAVVARNGLLEKSNVTTACSSLTATSPVGLCAWDATSASPTVASPAPAIDLSNDPNWQRYRYRVFETIIPLRNMIWSKDTL
jgi:type IV pilus assembly protein PilW